MDLLEPFAYAFFRQGFLMAVLASGLCALVGTYVVLRGMSYIGHGLSHAVFGGAAAAFVMGVNFFLGAAIWGLVSALMINRVARRRSIGADAAIGVITTASFALGIAILSRAEGFTRSFEAALFGNVLGVDLIQLATLAGITVAVVTVIGLYYRRFLFLTFDAEVAAVFGLRVAQIDALMAALLALAIIGSMQVLGVTLIAAALVTPPVIARLLTDRFGTMLIASTSIGMITGAVGLYLSYFLDIASGASVVLTQATVFVVAYVGSALAGRRKRLEGLAGAH